MLVRIVDEKKGPDTWREVFRQIKQILVVYGTKFGVILIFWRTVNLLSHYTYLQNN
jgi:hypothetical protein